MAAFNVVRFRVKPDRETEFVEAHRQADAEMNGLRSAALVKTGDLQYCFVGEWDAFDNIIGARPQMIGILDRIRDMLEDLGGELGVTDPASGEVVVQLKTGARKASKRTARPAKKRPAKKVARATSKRSRGAAKKKPAGKSRSKKARRR